MKLKVLIIVAIFAFPIFANPQKTKYIGYKHRGVVFEEVLPNGAKHLGGGLLADEDYGVSRFKKGANFMLWLEKITDRDADGVPDWEVRDVLIFPNLKKNQDFLFSYSSTCRLNGKFDLNLVVKVENVPNARNYKVLEAWKADTGKEKFEKIPVRGIRCSAAAH